VILIGQPELQQLLQRNDLRQLAQRITARYHLLPLDLNEVQHYLKYRLQVAGCSRPVFSPKAVTALYQQSGGIPRLLNLLADRAMLAAYSQQKPMVEVAQVQRAASEVLPLNAVAAGTARVVLPGWFWPLMAGTGIVVGFLLAMVLMPVFSG